MTQVDSYLATSMGKSTICEAFSLQAQSPNELIWGEKRKVKVSRTGEPKNLVVHTLTGSTPGFKAGEN